MADSRGGRREPGQGLPWFASSFRLAGSNHLEDPASGSKCISKMEGKLGCSGSQGLGVELMGRDGKAVLARISKERTSH